MFNGKIKRRVKELENKVRTLENSVASLNCEKGRHKWQTVNAEINNPKYKPYLRCEYCYAQPTKGEGEQ